MTAPSNPAAPCCSGHTRILGGAFLLHGCVSQGRHEGVRTCLGDPGTWSRPEIPSQPGVEGGKGGNAAKLSRGGPQENTEHVQNVGCTRPGL